jgi:hypothetical protein
MSEKIIGYILLLFGLLIIFYSVFSAYEVFNKKSKPVDLFSFPAISMDYSKLIQGAPPNADMKQELIAPAILNEPTNYIAHLLLMGFIATAGYKIASIGTMLLRTIKVNLKEESIKPLDTNSTKPPWK